MTTLRAGVIVVQGDVSEHADTVEWATEARGVDAEIVRIRSDNLAPDCDILLMPGGKSTTISRLFEHKSITDETRAHVEAGKPVLTTYTGLIVAPRNIEDDRVTTLGLLDATTDRSAFDRQADSSRAPLGTAGFDSSFPAVFTRALLINEVGEGVEMLTRWDGNPVAVHNGPAVGMSFCPESTPNNRLHDLVFFDKLAVGIDT